MTTLIYSDVHLGVTRTANTTPASRQRLKDAIYQQAVDIVRTDDCYKVCAGDLFDTYSNPEEIIKQGLSISDQTDIMLGGNHDVVARADKQGSLELLEHVHPNRNSIILPIFEAGVVRVRPTPDGLFYCVPHCTTQDLFETSLASAITASEERADTRRAVLLAHCNYESPHELTETALNMTEEMAEELLQHFDYIFLGHEHQPRDLFGGRLLVIGNIHPTGFADISDKFVIVLDEKGARREKIWDAKEGYCEIHASKLADSMDLEGFEFLRIVGDVKPEAMTDLSRRIAKIWKQEDSPYGIRLDVNILRETDNVTTQKAGAIESLPALIERELEGSPLLDYWKEFAA